MTVTDNDVVRRQSFTHDGPIEIDIALGGGQVDVVLIEHDRRDDESTDSAGLTDDTDGPAATGSVDADLPEAAQDAGASAARPDDTDPHDAGPGPAAGAEPAETVDAEPHPAAATGSGGRAEITVEVRRAPTTADQWGISGLLSWVNGQFGGQLGSFGGDPDLVARAIRETEIALHGRRLVVHAPKDARLRAVPLFIGVRAPGGSSLRSDAGAADVTVDGPAARVDAHSDSGRVRVDRASEPVDIRTGSGSVQVGEALGGFAARGGSSDVRVAALAGEVTVETGSGSVQFGTLDAGGVHVRTGSGDVEIRDAIAGSVRAHTGSGSLTIGIHAGVDAELNVSSGSGSVLHEFEVSAEPPSSDREVPLRLTGRTGSGSILLRRAQ